MPPNEFPLSPVLPAAGGGRRIPGDDARAILRLIADVATSPDEIVAKRRTLMTGLATLVGADSWTWCYGPSPIPGEPANVTVQVFDGFSPEQLPHYFATANHPAVGELSSHFFQELAQRNEHLTRTQPQLDPEGRFYESEARELFAKAGIGAVMLSHRPLPAGAQSVVCLYRRPGRPHFDTREARIAHILLTEVAWLHDDAGFSGSAALSTRLSPRERLILNLALEGRSREKIAATLALSVHTVNDHLKSVYRKFGVSGRARLLARFR